MSSKVYNLNDEEFKELIASKYSYSDCLRELGLSPRGGSSSRILKKRISDLGCSTEHFSTTASKAYIKYELEEILVENSSYINMERLKIRLIREKYLDNKCAICGIDTWLGQPISLHLHHKDGRHNNHSIDNLELLCPNCHSQTDTYAGKNIRE